MSQQSRSDASPARVARNYERHDPAVGPILLVEQAGDRTHEAEQSVCRHRHSSTENSAQHVQINSKVWILDLC
jgi:hypothetical protein